MRILMLNSEFPPLGGGMGVVNKYLINELIKHENVQIDLVTSSPTKNTYEQVNYVPGVIIYKVPINNHNVHHFTNRELLVYTYRAFLLALRLTFLHHYDIGLAFSAVPAGGVAYGLSLLRHLPYFVRVSGPDIPGFENRYNGIYPALVPIIRQIWKRSTGVIVKCKHEQDMVLKILPSASINKIPNAVDSDFFTTSISGPCEDNKIIDILCVARLIERKGQHHLLDAVSLMLARNQLSFKIRFVGTGDAEESLKSHAIKLGISDRVEFLGYVPREMINLIYQEADIFVLPSFNEGMSVATLEAMASGLPLIVTQSSGLEELIDGNGFTFDWGDIIALSKNVECLMKDEILRKRMGARSRTLSQLYNWQNVGDIYNKLLYANHKISPQNFSQLV